MGTCKTYTKTGDKGTTGLIGGTRVKKSDLRLETYGTVDELNSYIGLIRSHDIDPHTQDILLKIQHRLFTVGGRLATDDRKLKKASSLAVNEDDISLLEQEIDNMEENLPKQTHFVLPGGDKCNAYCHVARTVCRRAERRIIELNEDLDIDTNIMKYINRLSDYLFVLSRKVIIDQKKDEIKWYPDL